MIPEQIYKLAIDKWGLALQKIMVIEEMSELTKEISKSLRGKGNTENIAEEIADVTIMLEQLIVIYDNESLVSEYKKKKLDRLESMVKQ